MAYISFMSIPAAVPEPEDGSGEQDPSARDAASQNSNVPLGWKPTPSEPVPVVRCVQIKKDGNRCGRWSIRGYTKCIVHAGPQARMADGNVSKYAEAIIESARLRLIDNTDMALDQLFELAQPGSGESIRLKASTEILDRAGIRGGFEVKIDAEITESPAEVIRKRIEELKKGADTAAKMRADREAELSGDIVDAELVEDPDQPGLFDLPEEESTDDTE